jgi:rhodanese-related sulfurtransferase
MITASSQSEITDNLVFFEDKLEFETSPNEVKLKIEQGQKLSIIDLRQPKEFAQGHVPGATNILLDDLEERLLTLDRSVPVIVYCYDCVSRLSTHAALRLARRGFKVTELIGGYEGWLRRERTKENESVAWVEQRQNGG